MLNCIKLPGPLSKYLLHRSQWRGCSQIWDSFCPPEIITTPLRRVWRLEVMLHAFLTLALEEDEWSASGPTTLPRYPLDRRQGGPSVGLDIGVAKRICLPLPIIEPRSSSSQPVTTDWQLAHLLLEVWLYEKDWSFTKLIVWEIRHKRMATGMNCWRVFWALGCLKQQVGRPTPLKCDASNYTVQIFYYKALQFQYAVKLMKLESLH